jgi:nicotinamidase-related amidase
MTSQAIRDPLADHLITPQNATFVLIDYQPSQFATVRSMDAALLLKNIVSTVKTARAFGLPIVHSTVNVRRETEAIKLCKPGDTIEIVGLGPATVDRSALESTMSATER